MLDSVIAETTDRAIVLMAAKLSRQSGGPLVEHAVIKYLDDGVHPAALITGLMNLSTILLARVEKLGGRDPLGELGAIAWAVRATTEP